MAAIEVTTKGFDRAVSQQERINKAVEQHGKALNATAKEVQRTATVQQKIIRETETAQERYNRKMREARVALAGHAREVDLLARYENKLQTELRETEKAIASVKEESEGAFDVGRVSKWVTALAGSVLSIQGVAAAVAEVRRNVRDVADGLNQDSNALGDMLQMAGPDPAMGRRLVSMADATFKEGHVQNRDEAYRLVTELKSTEQLEDRKFYSKLATIDDPVMAARSVGLIKEVFRGGDAVGTAEEVFSKMMAAAGPAIGVSGSEMAAAVADAAVPAQAFGLKDEEVTGMVAQVAKVIGKGPESGQVVRQFLSTLIGEGLADQMKGQGIEPIIDYINKMGLDEFGMREFFGNDYAYKAFSQLKKKDETLGMIDMVKKAEQSRFATRTADMALGFEQVAAPVRERAGKASVAVSREEKATRMQTAQSIQDQRVADMESQGYSDFSIWLTNWALGMGRGLGMVPGLGDAGLVESESSTNEWQRRQLQLLEGIEKNTQGGSSIPVR